jgi:DNA (cytosine-5)-methyltransferase 1
MVPDADCEFMEDGRQSEEFTRDCEDASNANGKPENGIAEPRGQCGFWVTEPNVGRVANGIPRRVDRLRGIGNAVVPQVAEWIGRRIVAAEARK